MAGGGNVAVSLSSAATKVKPGDSFDVQVLVNPNKEKVSAAQVFLSVSPKETLTVNKITPGNFFLGSFNLLPLPPLDGSKILAGVLPNNLAEEIYKLERFGFLIIFAILFLAPNLIHSLISPLSRVIISLLLPG